MVGPGFHLSVGNYFVSPVPYRVILVEQEKKGNPLTFLVVLNSGHMVPLDHPRPSLDLITRFLKGKPFSDSEQKAIGVGSCSDPKVDCTTDDQCAGYAAALSDAAKVEKPAISTSPPRVLGVPRVGGDFAIVEFEHGGVRRGGGWAGIGGNGAGNEGKGDGKAEVNYEVRSSPDGHVGYGSSSPVKVDNLTPGRTYTFSVTAVYSDWVTGEGEDDAQDSDGWNIVRSESSVGSPAVTPGCGPGDGKGRRMSATDSPETIDEACSGHGVCKEGGEGGVCTCENGYFGDACGMFFAREARWSGGAKGETEESGAGSTKILTEKDIAVLKGSGEGTDSVAGCEVGLWFLLRPGVFRDPEFVFAIRLPRVVPPVEIAGTGDDSEHPLPGIFNDKDFLEAKASAFSNLLRADIGQSLGVPLDAVDLEGVSTAGETIVDWQSWPQWAEGSLNVSVVIKSEEPSAVGRRLISAWNNPESGLHSGAMSGLIDFSKGAEVKVLSQRLVHASQTNEDDIRGPAFLAFVLYVACFALAVPACGVSRRFCLRRYRNHQRCANTGGDEVGGGAGLVRRGWRFPLGRWGGKTGRVGGGGLDGRRQEMAPLTGREEECERSGTERTRV